MNEKSTCEALQQKINELEQENDRLRYTEKINYTLFDISRAVNSNLNLKELYAAIHKALDRLIDLPNFYISIYNQENNSIRFPYFVDQVDDKESYIEEFIESQSLTSEIIFGQKPLFLDALSNLMNPNRSV